MITVYDYYQNPVIQLSSQQLIDAFEDIKQLKQSEIELLKEKIKQYEQKRRSHEVWYQSLSPVRRFFAGRPPVHHQAVEYLVNVKERFQQIEQIHQKISELDRLIQLVQMEVNREQLILNTEVIDDLKRWMNKGGMTE